MDTMISVAKHKLACLSMKSPSRGSTVRQHLNWSRADNKGTTF